MTSDTPALAPSPAPAGSRAQRVRHEIKRRELTVLKVGRED